MVDEYQDTNTSQFKLVAMLAAKYGNICVVGDDDRLYISSVEQTFIIFLTLKMCSQALRL